MTSAVQVTSLRFDDFVPCWKVESCAPCFCSLTYANHVCSPFRITTGSTWYPPFKGSPVLSPRTPCRSSRRSEKPVRPVNPSKHVGSSQNRGPILVIGDITAPNIYGHQKVTLILGSTHMLLLLKLSQICFILLFLLLLLRCRVGEDLISC